ncbi:MAG: DUF1007 family protein [Fibrobacter sp.]|nr:DUF1007 family protein [Fibrobacter sp.]
MRFVQPAIILALCFAAMAGAHPHVFADVTTIAVFDNSGFVGLKNHWVFDEMYSAAILASADQDNDGKISEKEAPSIKDAVLGPIAASNYYNYVVVGTEFLATRGVQNFKASMKNGKLTLDFIVSFPIPAKNDYTMVTVAVSDPTNYIQITADMENADVEAPDEMDVDFFSDNLKGLTLFRAFRSEVQGLYLRFKK